MSQVRVTVTPQQGQFIACPQKWAGIRGGVGSGKTFAICLWAFGRMGAYPNSNHFVIGADYEQLRRGFFQTFIGILENTLGWTAGRDFFYREQPSPMITFKHTGARLRALSAEQAERIRSIEIQTMVLEEPQTWRGGVQVWQVLVGRLRHSQRSATAHPEMQPQGRMSFNPPAVGSWLHDLIETKWRAFGFPCWQFSVRQNVLLPGLDEYVQNLKNAMSPDRWPVEIDGHWAVFGGDVYRGFDPQTHGVRPAGLPDIKLDPNRPLMWSLDFNVEWMSSVVAQLHTQRRKVVNMEQQAGKQPKPIHAPEIDGYQGEMLYVLRELFLHDAGTPDVLERFLQLYGDVARQNGVYLFGDASGGSRAQTMSSTAAARSNWEIIVQGLIEAGIRITVCIPMANPAVMDRINAVRAQFRTGAGVGMMVDLDRCGNLVDDFRLVRFKQGTNDIDKSDKTPEGLKRTHLSDALGYLVHTHRRMMRRERIEFQSFLGR